MSKFVLAFSVIVNVFATFVCGDEIDIKDAPYQASIQINGSHICSGALFDNDLVMTASICFPEEIPMSYVKVRVGSTLSNEGGQLMSVKEIVSHGSISLIRLTANVTLSDSVEVIPLPTKKIKKGTMEFKNGTKAYISGYKVRDSAPQHLTGEKFELDSCHVSEFNTICANGAHNEKFCNADNGTVVVINEKLHGVVPRTFKCGDSLMAQAGVLPYISVTAYGDWIRSKIPQF